MSRDIPQIGIDFGSIYARVSWWNPASNSPELVRDEHGDAKVPCILYKDAKKTLIGRPAEEQLAEAAHLGAKAKARITGGTFTSLRSLLDDNLPIAIPGIGKPVSPHEIVGEFLAHLSLMAERAHFAGSKVTSVAIAHPSWLGNGALKNLKRAAEFAGFKDVALVEEALAALNGCSDDAIKKARGVLVVDMGGGSIDASFICRDERGQCHQPVESVFDQECGGNAFDRLLYDHWEKVFSREQGRGFTEDQNEVDLGILSACRKGRERLSSVEETLLAAPVSGCDTMARLPLDTAGFKEILGVKVERVKDLVKDLLQRIEASSNSLDSILLVGGMSYMPLLQNTLKRGLSSKLVRPPHSEEIVAMGALTSMSAVGFKKRMHAPEKLLKSLEPAKLVITSTPPGALISVNGKDSGATPCSVAVGSGEFKVRCRLEGYHQPEQIIVMEGVHDKPLHFALKPFIGINIVTDPPHAQVTISGGRSGSDSEKENFLKQGVSPCRIELAQGVYLIKIKKDGYMPIEQRCDYAGHQMASMALRLQKDSQYETIRLKKRVRYWVNVLPLIIGVLATAAFFTIDIWSRHAEWIRLANARELEEALSQAAQERLMEDKRSEYASFKASENKRAPGTEHSFELYPAVSFKFCWIPPGSFVMGSQGSEPGHIPDEYPPHIVEFSRGFWMSKYEITQDQWITVMGFNPSFSSDPLSPVEQVTHIDCREFINKVNAHIRTGVVFSGVYNGRAARISLPSEAEWEYACRANDSNRWTLQPTNAYNTSYEVDRVGQYVANAWGLHDMLGNVMEWTGSTYALYPSVKLIDPVGSVSDGSLFYPSRLIVARGGPLIRDSRHYHKRPDTGWRLAQRYKFEPDEKDKNLGFRLVLSFGDKLSGQ